MTEIDEIHPRVLFAIKENGVLVGVPLYRRNKHVYEALPLKKAQPYWTELKTAIESIHHLTPASILMKDDPLFTNGPSQTDYQLNQRREVRENPDLTSDIVDFIFGFYERTIHLVNEMDKIPLAPPYDSDLDFEI